jgi:hypothetical protein
VISAICNGLVGLIECRGPHPAAPQQSNIQDVEDCLAAVALFRAWYHFPQTEALRFGGRSSSIRRRGPNGQSSAEPRFTNRASKWSTANQDSWPLTMSRVGETPAARVSLRLLAFHRMASKLSGARQISTSAHGRGFSKNQKRWRNSIFRNREGSQQPGSEQEAADKPAACERSHRDMIHQRPARRTHDPAERSRIPRLTPRWI